MIQHQRAEHHRLAVVALWKRGIQQYLTVFEPQYRIPLFLFHSSQTRPLAQQTTAAPPASILEPTDQLMIRGSTLSAECFSITRECSPLYNRMCIHPELCR
jgi:hypothetical protein